MGARKPIAERLEAKTDRAGECWLWTGAVANSGYGRIGTAKGTDQVHRVAYEVHNGPIPEGLHIDHLCSNRLCVKPSHLEAVTQQENNRRAAVVRRSNLTECKWGHAFTLENTIEKKGGGRNCRRCGHLRSRATRTGQPFAELLAIGWGS